MMILAREIAELEESAAEHMKPLGKAGIFGPYPTQIAYRPNTRQPEFLAMSTAAKKATARGGNPTEAVSIFLR